MWLLNRIRKIAAVGIRGAFLYKIGKTKKERLMTIPYVGQRLRVRSNGIDIGVAMTNAVDEFSELSKLFGENTPLRLIDAGAFIGTSTIVLRNLFPDSTVVAIEPNKANFDLLSINLNQMTSVCLLNRALTGSEGQEIVLRDRNKGPWGYTSVSEPADSKNPAHLHPCRTVSLERLRRDLGSIDLIKMDIEGAEREVAISERDELLEIPVILVELHERISPGVESLFSDLLRGRDNKKNGEKMLSVDHDLLKSRLGLDY